MGGPSHSGIDLDGFLFDEVVAQIGVPEVAERFLAGEENRLVDLAAEQWGAGSGRFEHGAATRAFG